jgi:hypothetical protein
MMYDFTSHWFLDSKSYWETIFREFDPKSALELGSYEGQASVFMIENGIEKLDCVDMWSDSAFDDASLTTDPDTTKIRFRKNIMVAQEGNSGLKMDFDWYQMSSMEFLKGATDTYDLIYIDASHRAKDVLSDAVLSFDILKPGGLMVFDDYDWLATDDPTGLQRPSLAIDAWANVMKPFIKEWGSTNPRQKYYVKTLSCK